MNQDEQPADILAELDDSKARQAWFLRRRGESVTVIADKLEISREHCSRLISGYVEQLAADLSNAKALDLLAGELADITSQIKRAETFLVTLLAKHTVNDAGVKEYGTRQTQVIQAQERLIRTLKKDKTDLLLECGVIPRAPERHQLVQALAAEISVKDNSDAEDEMTIDELKAKIISTLQTAKFIR